MNEPQESSSCPWRRIKIDVPHEIMLAEALNLLHKFVSHRSRVSRGWRSLCLHGLGSEKTLAAADYGYPSEAEAPHDWTDIVPDCPASKAFISSLPMKKLYRVRFMLLEPGGYILPHSDKDRAGLGPLNVALSHPAGCALKFAEGGVVPFAAGRVFMLDVSKVHAVINVSKRNRIHMIITGKYQKVHPLWNQSLEKLQA